jgi:predicted DNA-binding transcriptional regulator AlpA
MIRCRLQNKVTPSAAGIDMKENPFPQWPRGLRRTLAAEYIGVSLPLFDKLVLEGQMPKPKRIYGRTIWDRVAVDRAFDLLDGGSPLDESGEEVIAWDAGSGQQTVIRYSFRPPMRPQIIALKALYENRGKAIHTNQTAKGVGGGAFYKLSYIGFARHVSRSARGKDSDWFESTEDGEQAWLQILEDNPSGIDWLK